MKHSTEIYKGYSIVKRIDIPTHTCIIYLGNDMIKCISGNISTSGSEDSIIKAKKYINNITIN